MEWSFANTDYTWKNKTGRISTEIFRIVTSFSKIFLQIQSFFIVWNQKQMIFILAKTGSRKIDSLISNGLAKLLPRIQNLYQITYIFCNTVACVSILPFDTNWLAPREALGLQCICWAQLLLHTPHLPCSLPCNYLTSPLSYCRR